MGRLGDMDLTHLVSTVAGMVKTQDLSEAGERLRRRGTLRAFHWTVLAVLALLVPQFVLGMVINLYVTFPRALDGRAVWRWALSNPVISSHIYLGTALVLLAIAAVVTGAMARRAAALIPSLAGFLLLLFTWFSGDLFLSVGQQSVRSISMACGFLAALLVFAVAYRVTDEEG